MLRSALAQVTGRPGYAFHFMKEDGTAVGYRVISDVFVDTNVISHMRNEDNRGVSGEGGAAGDVPIDMSCYKHRSNVQILTEEMFVTMDDIGERIHAIDIKNVLKDVTATDEFTLEMIYYGFVVKFWPSINPALFYSLARGGAVQRDISEQQDVSRWSSSAVDGYYSRLEIAKKDAKFRDFVAESSVNTNKIRFGFRSGRRDLFAFFNDVDVRPTELATYKTVVSGTPRLITKVHRRHGNIRHMLEYTKNMHRSPKDYVVVVGYEGADSREGKKPPKDEKLPNNEKSTGDGATSRSPFTTVTFFTEEFAYHKIIWDVNTELDLDGLGKEARDYMRERFGQDDAFAAKVTDLNINISWPGGIPADLADSIKDQFLEDERDRLVVRMENRTAYQYMMRSYKTGFVPDIGNTYAYIEEASIRDELFRSYMKHPTIEFHVGVTQMNQVTISDVGEKDYKDIADYVLSKVFAAAGSGPKRPSRQNKLKVLKSIDPVLYDHPGPPLVSRYCQRQHQPLIYTEKEAKRLEDEGRTKGDTKEKRRLTRYKNATTGEDVYYECPNPRFPNLGFITEKHPEGYCVPCCKKIEHLEVRTDVVNKRDIVYKTCMECGKYKGEYSDAKTSYVFNFGKLLEKDRIGFLPELLARYVKADMKYDADKLKDAVTYKNVGVLSKKKLLSLASQARERTLLTKEEGGSKKEPKKEAKTEKEAKADKPKKVTYNGISLLDIVSDQMKYRDMILRARAAGPEVVVVNKEYDVILGIDAALSSLLKTGVVVGRVLDDGQIAQASFRFKERSRYEQFYYLLGVQHNTSNVANASALFCISAALERPVDELLEEMAHAADQIPGFDRDVARGLRYVNSGEHIGDRRASEKTHKTDDGSWNDTFIFLTEAMGYGVFVIDVNNGFRLRGEARERNIVLLRRPKVADVLDDGNVYDLAVYLNPKTYFSRRSVISCVFDKDDVFVRCLSRLIVPTGEVRRKDLPGSTPLLDSHGRCYAVYYEEVKEDDVKKGDTRGTLRNITFPVYGEVVTEPTSRRPAGRRPLPTARDVCSFIRLVDRDVQVRKILLYQGRHAIGFDLSYGYVYFKDTSIYDAVKLVAELQPDGKDRKTKNLLWNLPYRPDYINQEMTKPARHRDYDGAFKRSYRYYIFLTDLFDELKKEKNEAVRRKITASVTKDRASLEKVLEDALKGYPQKCVTDVMETFDEALSLDVVFLRLFEVTRYDFDDVTMNKWRRAIAEDGDDHAGLKKLLSRYDKRDAELLFNDLTNPKKRELMFNYVILENIKRFVPIRQKKDELVFIR